MPVSSTESVLHGIALLRNYDSQMRSDIDLANARSMELRCFHSR